MRVPLLRQVTMRRALLGVVALGLTLRGLAFLTSRVSSDASSFGVMAVSLLARGEFVMPLGEYWSDSWAPTYSHHYSPGYPVFLVPFVAIGGFTPWAIKAAGLVSGVLALLTVGWTTRDLYGPDRALVVTAVAAVDPILVKSAGIGYSENLLVAFFILTIWAILKSLSRERFIVLAGLFAGLAFLTKGVMGWFFLVAGFAGLAWRFHFMRWRVFRQTYYLLAIAVFGAFVLLWSFRNLSHFWDGSVAGLLTAWQSSAYFSTAFDESLARPGDLAFILLARIPLYIGFFLFFGGFWARDLRRAPKITDEHYSGLWLAVGLTYVLAWIIAGILWVHERNPVFWVDQLRYVAVGTVPLFWLVVKDADLGSVAFRRKLAATLVVLLAVAVLGVSQPAPGVYTVYDALNERVAPGDVVAVDGLLRYEVMLYVGGDVAYVPYAPGVPADFVITANLSRVYPGYVLLATGVTPNTIAGLVPAFDGALWGRP